MCRPEKPITTSNTALRELQEWLRDQRARTGQGYRALSVRAGCHATTLQRAASSETVPKLPTVLNYARACDASPDEARRLWKRARHEETRLARGGRSLPAPRPELIRDFADLGAALVDLYEKAGSPALRTMEQRAGGFGSLPSSTARRIRTKQAMPHGLSQFQAYLRACEVPEADWPDWENAWTRAWRHEKHDDFAALGSSTADVDILEAMALTPKDILATARVDKRLRERFQKEYRVVADADGEILIVRAGSGRRMPVQVVKRREVPGRLRPPQMGRVLGKYSEPSEQQLSFAIPYSELEREPAPGALF
ncbi:helix-turn-helix transcriptional regulator [Streptomyces sp. DT2A-34]|uniref:helix-turn-helix domain-containing protein n=1 Tax=unclassified Streptomyces TaxID=2593676 RepID=UPI00265BF46A|nr:helix-turn-helix transcriptional regulator [Streptomyces sp. DT2A-34]MDO0917795.1 helix-turn-helix transcriptional regulator [Streptomyces sp. DT2A-34]